MVPLDPAPGPIPRPAPRAALRSFALVASAPLAALALVACGASDGPGPDPDPAPGPDPRPGAEAPEWGVDGDVAAVYDGAIGTGDTANARLRRTIPVDAPDDDALRVGTTAWLTRETASSTSGRLVLPVRNDGDEALCFVHIEAAIVDGAGAELADASTYVDGVSGTSDASGVDTTTCLRPGGAGAFLEIDTSPGFWSDAARLEVTDVSGRSGFEVPGPLLESESYTVSATSVGTEFDLVARNVSDGTVVIGDDAGALSTYVLLDDGGVPLLWDFFEDEPEGNVSAGDTAAFGGRTSYEGTADGLVAFYDAAPVAVIPVSRAADARFAPAPGATDAERLRLRDARERAAHEAHLEVARE